MSDPAGPSPRITLPSVTDMHPDDPRRHASLLIVSAVDRVAHIATRLVLERISSIMPALDDLVSAVNDEVDTINVAIQHMQSHSAVQADGTLTSLAQRIRNSTQSLKDALAAANTSGNISGSDISGPQTTVPGGSTDLGVDRGNQNTTVGGPGGLGASAGTPVGPTARDLNPNAGADVGTTSSASSDTGSRSPSETLLNPDNPSPQAGTPTGPGSEKAGGTAGSSKVE